MKPRLRILPDGWIRHDGAGFPPVLSDDTRVKVRTRSGNAAFMDGCPAGVFIGWHHSGFSGDILFWREA